MIKYIYFLFKVQLYYYNSNIFLASLCTIRVKSNNNNHVEI